MEVNKFKILSAIFQYLSKYLKKTLELDGLILSIDERLPISKLSPGIDHVQIKLVVHLPTAFAICVVYSWFSRENNLLPICYMYARCVRN